LYEFRCDALTASGSAADGSRCLRRADQRRVGARPAVDGPRLQGVHVLPRRPSRQATATCTPHRRARVGARPGAGRGSDGQHRPGGPVPRAGGCWVRDVTGRASEYDDEQVDGDPDPVRAPRAADRHAHDRCRHPARTANTPTDHSDGGGTRPIGSFVAVRSARAARGSSRSTQRRRRSCPSNRRHADWRRAAEAKR